MFLPSVHSIRSSIFFQVYVIILVRTQRVIYGSISFGFNSNETMIFRVIIPSGFFTTIAPLWDSMRLHSLIGPLSARQSFDRWLFRHLSAHRDAISMSLFYRWYLSNRISLARIFTRVWLRLSRISLEMIHFPCPARFTYVKRFTTNHKSMKSVQTSKTHPRSHHLRFEES